ncbi:unnamed protein product, partial [Timema podura]|nr:unnamed protein product [Timema podura]
SEEPPKNEFTVGMKLEALDPRNLTSTCFRSNSSLWPQFLLKTLNGAEMALPRMFKPQPRVAKCNMFEVGMKLEAVDRKNPQLICAATVGFRMNASSWPSFMLKSLSTAHLAPEDIFVDEPKGPKQNLFEAGMKLEAVDKKNPHLICVATVVMFSSEVSYSAEESKVINLEPSVKVILSSVEQEMQQTLEITVTCFICELRLTYGIFHSRPEYALSASRRDECNEPALALLSSFHCAIRGEMIHVTFDGWRGAFDYWCRYDSRDIFPVGWCCKSKHPMQPPGQKTAHGSSRYKTRVCNIPPPMANTTTAETKQLPPLPRPLPAQSQQQTSVVGSSVASPPIPPSPETPPTLTTATPSPRGPATTSPLVNEPETGAESRGDQVDTTTIAVHDVTSTQEDTPSVTIHVNQGCQCGPYLDPRKVKKLPPQFQSESLNWIVKESVQSLVNAATNQRHIFGMLRQGDGKVYITASYENKVVNIRLPPFENETNMWDFFEILFDEMGCCPRLYSHQRLYTRCPTCYQEDTPVTPSKRAADAPLAVGEPSRKRRWSSGSSDSNSQVRSSPTNAAMAPTGPSSPQQPRRSVPAELEAATSTTPHSENSGNAKVSTDANEWSIDDVIHHIYSVDPTLGVHADVFRKHEIDGKALLLLSSEMMMKYMGLKLGPALKICNLVSRIDALKHLPS